MKRYPFKFLDSYGKEDTDIYFGREEEINTLYEMVFEANSLLVYGASGTGKTSLIQCGLAGRFKSYDWLPLMIRRGTNMNDSLVKILKETGGDFGKEDKETDFSKLIRNVYLNKFKPIYLIFDQFEELFILSEDPKEKELFTKSIQEILLCEQPVKMIFSIREEYLGYLYDFEKDLPQLFKKKLRVEAMNIRKLKEFLNEFINNKELIVTIKEDEIGSIADLIFDKLTGKQKSPYIQLPYLQVFLDKLYWEITKDDEHKKEATITLEALRGMGNIGDVLSDFLEDQVKSISDINTERKIYGEVSPETIWKILSQFATLEGTKKPIYIKKGDSLEIDVDKALVSDCIPEFNARRILKVVDTSDEGDSYELAHDALAKCIAEKRSGEEKGLLETRMLIRNQVFANELFSQNLLNRIEYALPKIKLTPEEAKLIKDSKAALEKQKRDIEEAKEKQREEERKREEEKKEAEREEEKREEKRKREEEERKRKWLKGGLVAAAIALGIMIGLSIWAFDQKDRAEASLIETYRTEIKRFDKEIKMEKIGLASLKTYDAPDVVDRVNDKIDSLEIDKEYYKRKIDSVLRKKIDTVSRKLPLDQSK